MPNPVILAAGATIGASAISANASSKAGDKAANAQIEAADMGVAESRRQFDFINELLSPYVSAGTDALSQQMTLAGMNGEAAQLAAIEQIQGGSEFQSLLDAGESAILANASATGGLRGGNTQRALGELSPEILSSLIDKQYQRLGGFAAQGQNAAAGLGSAAVSTGDRVSTLFGQSGAAAAGAHLASGNAQAQLFGDIGATVGGVAGQFAVPQGTPGGLPEGATLFGEWGF